MVKVVEVAGTPNPDALKFIVDAPLSTGGAKSFDDAAAGRGDPLASALFALGSVSSVFIMDRFVTVSKPPDVPWEGLQPRVISAVEANAQPVAAATPPEAVADGAGAPGDILRKINDILDQNVRPALAGDGGGVEVLDFKENVLTVHYQGACGSCPSAASGTLFAIQNLLQRMIDPKIQVVPDM